MKQYTVNGKTIVFGTFEELNVPKGHLCYSTVTRDLFNENTYYIAYDKYFTELSPMSQKFLIYHELGHIENGDFNMSFSDINKMNFNRVFGITNKIEFNADKFAISKTGKKAALKCFIEMKQKNHETGLMDLINRAIAVIF